MTTDVYKQIRGAILEGRFEGGRLLSENALATQFGTSRTPVREALHRLEIERLVERGPRGTAVRAPSPDEILDIYEVRVTLEASAARAAALRATALDIVQLRNSQEHMRAVTDPADRPTTNRAFHRVVWQATAQPWTISCGDCASTCRDTPQPHWTGATAGIRFSRNTTPSSMPSSVETQTPHTVSQKNTWPRRETFGCGCTEKLPNSS
jgi:DNA-binding FadR family transcriptional regulator